MGAERWGLDRVSVALGKPWPLVGPLGAPLRCWGAVVTHCSGFHPLRVHSHPPYHTSSSWGCSAHWGRQSNSGGIWGASHLG